MGLRINRQPRFGDTTGRLWVQQAKAQEAKLEAEREAAEKEAADAQAAAKLAEDEVICWCPVGPHPYAEHDQLGEWRPAR